MIPGLEGLTPIRIIGIIAGIAMGVFAFQYWILPRLQSARNLSSKLPEERAAEMMERFQRERNEAEGLSRDFSLAAPRITVLRTGRKDDTVLCIMANRGGTAINLDVESDMGIAAKIEPRSMLKNAETARIQLHGAGTTRAALQFKLSYDDSYGHRVYRTFAYADTTFKEV